MSFVFVDSAFVKDLKTQINSNHTPWKTVRYLLHQKAEELMTEGPFSVTFHPGLAESGDPHDYYSHGKYFWPDPQNPGGPYIMRDGETNPEYFSRHKIDFDTMARTVQILLYAGYYLEEEAFVKRAAELLEVWFISPETRMNPHLEYAGAIKGGSSGNWWGIIDVTYLNTIVHCLGFLNLYEQYKKTYSDVCSWLEKMLIWLTKSEKGIQESKMWNNHATWWNALVASISSLLEDRKTFMSCIDAYKNHILPSQMAVDGSFPYELERPLSYFYSLFNLDAFVLNCEVAWYNGVDLWNYQLPDGRGIKKGIEFIRPFIDNHFLWKHRQISENILNDNVLDESLILQYASLRLGMEECLDIAEKKRNGCLCIKCQYPFGPNPLGPTMFLPGFRFKKLSLV